MMRAPGTLNGSRHLRSAPAPAARREPPTPRVSWRGVDLVAFVVLYLGITIPVNAWILGIGPSLTGGKPTTAADTVYAVSHLGAVGLILLIVRVRGGRVAELGWRRTSPEWLLAALPLASATSILAYMLLVISRAVLHISGSVQCAGLQQAFGGGAGQVVLGVALACVVTPIVEETFYRGFFFGWLRTWLPLPVAVGVSAVVFGLAHHDAGLLLPMAGFGVVQAVVYQRSASLWPGMLAHGIFNAAAMLNVLHVVRSGC